MSEEIKIGDIVKVCEKSPHDWNTWPGFLPSMEKMCGKEYPVVDIASDEDYAYYFLVDCGSRFALKRSWITKVQKKATPIPSAPGWYKTIGAVQTCIECEIIGGKLYPMTEGRDWAEFEGCEFLPITWP